MLIFRNLDMSHLNTCGITLPNPHAHTGRWKLCHQIFWQIWHWTFDLCTPKKYSINVDWTGSTYLVVLSLYTWSCTHHSTELGNTWDPHWDWQLQCPLHSQSSGTH